MAIALSKDDSPGSRVAPTAVYCDGGLIQQGSDRIGGTWAVCHVYDHNGVFPESRVFEAAGAYLPGELGLAAVGNNTAEYLAAVIALEALPAGWSGPVMTDSGNTIGRLRDRWKTNGVPPALVARAEDALYRLGGLTWVLLGGHPTRSELALGRRRDGKPCSPHNVWCDKAADAAGKRLLAALRPAGGVA